MFFSRFVKSLNPAQREKIHFRLALLYAALAWNGFAIGIYLFTRDKKKVSGISKGFKTLSTSDTNTAQLIRFKGFNIVENTTYDKKQIDEIRQNILNPPVEEESHDFD